MNDRPKPPGIGRKRMQTRLGDFLRWLIRPSASIQDRTERRKARLLMLLLLLQIPLLALATAEVTLILGGEFLREPFFYGPAVTLAAFFMAYGLGKVGYYKVGTIVLIGTLYVSIWVSIVLNPIPFYISFDLLLIALLVPVLIAALFYSLRTVTVVAVLNLLLAGILPALLGVLFITSFTTLLLMAAISALILLAVYHYRHI